MELATTTTDARHDDGSTPRGRSRSSTEVNRWVAMIDAELRTGQDAAENHNDSVEVTLEFGRARIDLAAQPLQVGDSLRLDPLAEEPLDVVVAGRAVARGELVVVDGRLGVRIVELLLLILAWLVIATPTTFADERPRRQTSSTLFDDNPQELLETPFGSVRGLRSNDSETSWQDAVPSNAMPRTRETSSSVSGSRKAAPDSSELASPPLSPRSGNGSQDSDRASGNAAAMRSSWSATMWPLLLVMGLIVVGARWLKSRSPSVARGLPNEAFEVLGRKAIDARTSVIVARCGARLLVLNLSPHGLRTLAEISDPVEVDCLAGLCRATQRDQTLVETFRSLLPQPAGSKPASSAPLNSPPPTPLDERFAARLMAARTPPASSMPEVR